MLKQVAVLHLPQSEGAVALARQLASEFARRGVSSFVGDIWDPASEAHLRGAELAVCIGGDGTVLRAARLAIPDAVPILGINMGRLGFLTDMSPRDFFNQFERIVAKDWRIEQRVMVRADWTDAASGERREFHALNDVVVSRLSPGRPIYTEVSIDGTPLALYRCDGMIVATPTGSTGYSLSAGGPILAPTEHHLVVTPVSAHLALSRSLVLQPDSCVDLRVTSDHGAVVSVDGQEDIAMASGTLVSVRMSEHVSRFVRFRGPESCYGDLAEKLDIQLSSSMNRRA